MRVGHVRKPCPSPVRLLIVWKERAKGKKLGICSSRLDCHVGWDLFGLCRPGAAVPHSGRLHEGGFCHGTGSTLREGEAAYTLGYLETSFWPQPWPSSLASMTCSSRMLSWLHLMSQGGMELEMLVEPCALLGHLSSSDRCQGSSYAS